VSNDVENIGCAMLFAVALTLGLVCAVKGCDGGTEAAADKPADTVLIDGKPFLVHTISDTVQGKSWRAFYYDRALVIIPGSETTTAPEKTK
jgi:cytochrome c oxidase assembly protein Cox11